MDNKTLSNLFPYISGIPTNLSQEIDLNGDGYLERISLSDLGYSGGRWWIWTACSQARKR